MRSQHGQVGSQRCIRCNTCQAIFPDISQTIMHTKAHFSGSEGGSTRVEEVCATKLFVCEYCETFFASAEILNTHRKSHTSSKPFLCRSCPETFSNFTQADVHRRTHSNPNHLHNSSHMFTIPVVFLCEVCSRGFKLWESFHIHRLRDHEKLQECGLWLQGSDGIYECELCPDTFEQKKQLLGHIKLEHLKKKFECDECGKGFNVKGDLDNHRRSKHTKERPFKCPVCQKAFLTSGVFYQHRMMHAGIKNNERYLRSLLEVLVTMDTKGYQPCAVLTVSVADLDSDEESDKEEQWDNEVDDKTSKVIIVRVGSLRIDLLLKAAFGMARKHAPHILKLGVHSTIPNTNHALHIILEPAVHSTIPSTSHAPHIILEPGVNVGDEIDIIRGPSPLNSDFLIVSRVEVLSASENENSISVKLRRSKTLTIENYADSWKVSQDE
ncbi:unnamed protein product [Timema podura]|uniref:C2H2-type domain-containing protein n=1 Tax=Timema podura TaxID=61482 RepID=A0ABN7NVE2_TIMPD|nr:unnamed protein product [Timema podura]